MRDRILVYQRHKGSWLDALAQYKAQNLLLGVDVFVRRERCYKGVERCVRVWTENKAIADDYASIGVQNDLEL